MARIVTTIPYLTAKPLARGLTGWYWEPSNRLRTAGWPRLALGTDRAVAIERATARNAEVETWLNGGAKPREVRRIVAPDTMPALIARYEAEMMDDAARQARFERTLSDVTKRGYRYAFRAIEEWTQRAGDPPIAAITVGNCEKFKVALLTARAGAPRSHRAAAILTMLRTLLGFAAARSRRLIAFNPMEEVAIPQPPRRKRIIAPAAIAALLRAADALGRRDVALGITLGLWTVQREADLLRLTRANWRPCVDGSEADRAILAGTDGQVMGFRLAQGKTRTWVEIPASPLVRRAVEAAFALNAARAIPVTALIADEDSPRGTPQHKFQRGFKEARELAIETARADADDYLVEQLAGVQFRDLRRTGMCMMRDLGLSVALIANLSGHSIDETTEILKTYLPADPAASVAAVAMISIQLEKRAAAEARATA